MNYLLLHVPLLFSMESSVVTQENVPHNTRRKWIPTIVQENITQDTLPSDQGYKTAAKDILWEELATPQTPTVQEVKSKLKDINLQEDPNNITKFEDYLESGLDINFKFMNPHIFDKMTIIQLEDATKQPKNINKNKSTASEIPGNNKSISKN